MSNFLKSFISALSSSLSISIVKISLDLKSGRNIYPVLPGILEYSGYGAVNGHYILLSHPQIQTEDGYILHSMYCHLKKPLVKFNSYQKPFLIL